MSEQGDTGEESIDPPKEAFKTTGKQEFEVSSGQLFIGDPIQAPYKENEDKMHQLFWELEESVQPQRVGYLPNGVLVTNQINSWFHVYQDKENDLVRLVNADDYDETKDEKIDSAIELGQTPIAFLGSEQNAILIGDPESLSITENEQVFEIPNGKYHVTVIAAPTNDGYPYHVVREMEIKKLKEGEQSPNNSYFLVSNPPAQSPGIIH